MTSADQVNSARSRRGRYFDLWFPLIAVVIFLAFQVALVLTVDLPDYDEAVHLNIARNIRRTGIAYRLLGNDVLYTIHTPLYQYFLGLSTFIFGERLVVLRLLTVGFGLGTILLCYATGSILRDKVTGFAAALTLSLNPLFVLYSYFLREEVPMLFFMMLTVYFLAKEEVQSKPKYLTWAGVSIGIAVLLKEFALIFWFTAVIYAYLSGKTRKERLNRAARVGVPAILALLLWVLWAAAIDASQLRAAVLGWINGFLGKNVETYDPRYRVQLDEWLVTVGTEVLGWETLILLSIGLLLFIWRRPRQFGLVTALFLYSGLAFCLSLVSSLKEPRHLIGIVPMMALVIHMLIDWPGVLAWLRRQRMHALFTSVGLLLILILSWGLSPLKLPEARAWDDAESWWEPAYVQRMYVTDKRYGVLKQAGEYLKNHSDSDEIVVIVHEGTVLGYYADREYQFLYTLNFQQAMKALKNADVFVYDQPSFFRLKEDEIDSLWDYVNKYFEEQQVISDPYRDIIVYRRIEDIVD